MFKKMDNFSYQRDPEKATELELVRNLRDKNGGANQASTSCNPEACIAARQRRPGPDLSESPWHFRKTIYLLGIIVLLVLWIAVYTTLSQLKLL